MNGCRDAHGSRRLCAPPEINTGDAGCWLDAQRRRERSIPSPPSPLPTSCRGFLRLHIASLAHSSLARILPHHITPYHPAKATAHRVVQPFFLTAPDRCTSIMTTPAASASSSSHTPRRSLARPGAGMHTPTPAALRKPASFPVSPNHSGDGSDHRGSATPTSTRSSMPRPSLGARKSITNLRASLGPPSSSSQTARSATPDGVNLRASLPGPSTPSSARPSMSLSRTPLASSQLSSSLSSSHRVHTPTPAARSGRASSRFEPTAAAGAPPPVPSLDARYMRQTNGTSAKEGLRLTLDDLGAVMQIREGKEDGYKGILRFLGEIQGKGAVVFAGLELIDEWQGLGKNDGTVGA